MKIMYTGFEPFGGETVNPSWEAVCRLPEVIAGAEVLRVQLPTAFGRGAEVLREAIEEHRPECVICVGQAGGRATVAPEFVAINYRDARIPDNLGFQPKDCPIDPEGPAAYFTKLPVRRIAARCVEEGIPAAVSYTAGTYVCNELMYSVLRLSALEYPDMIAGFIHVPYAPQQAAGKNPPAPSMALDAMVEALRIAGEESIRTIGNWEWRCKSLQDLFD